MTSYCGVKRAIVMGLLLVCVGALNGCKADPAKNMGYVDPKLMKHDPDLPFHLAWSKPGFELDRYKKLYIAPVNTSFMLKETEWQQGERKGQIEQDVHKLGQFTQDAVKKAFREDPKHRFQVLEAETSDPDTLQFEIALTEVVPSKVALNAMGYAPFGIGLGITAVRAVAHDVSTVAFEARVRDAATKEIVVTFADREAEQAAAISVRGLTWYSHAEAIITQWSQQFVQYANRKPGEKIKEMDTFTLQPW